MAVRLQPFLEEKAPGSPWFQKQQIARDNEQAAASLFDGNSFMTDKGQQWQQHLYGGSGGWQQLTPLVLGGILFKALQCRGIIAAVVSG